MPYVEVTKVRELGLAFVDIAFDNFLADAIVQRKIRQAKEQVSDMHRQVEQALR